MGLEIVELVMAVEEEFGIEIPNQDAPKLAVLGDFCDYIISTLRNRGESPEPDQIWERFRKVVITQLGVKPHEVTRSAHLIADLRVD